VCEGGRRDHVVLVLWYVEDHVPLAHGGHGPLRHQLPALWCSKVLVRTARGSGQTTGTPCSKWVLVIPEAFHSMAVMLLILLLFCLKHYLISPCGQVILVVN